MSKSSHLSALSDRLAGTLLGMALGDALGLPAEGLSARTIERRFGRVERFRLLGRIGFVSDDTEQSALLAQALARHPDDPYACERAFRRSLLGWFARLPWGVGKATVLACLRMTVGIFPSGVRSAGNGSAMRAAILGTFFADDPERRRALGRRLAEVTHRDQRAVEGALYVAELAAECGRSAPDDPRLDCQQNARSVVTNDQLGEALDQAVRLALQGESTLRAAEICGTSGFVVHSLAFATFAFLRHGDDPLAAIAEVISGGGDTDSTGAILGGWLGALHGESGLPTELLSCIHDGPFGPTHLRALAACLNSIREGKNATPPGFSATAALVRNVALFPIILGHGLRRLIPL